MSWSKPIPKHPIIAVVGATGVVGQEMLNVLEQRNFFSSDIRAFASKRSAGQTVFYGNTELTVQELTEESFEGIDVALFAAGAWASQKYREAAVGSGTVIIDNSSAFRMDDDVPLIVPEVNPQDIKWHSGVIANPNCSTIQMVVALKPLYDAAGLKRVVVSTYQAASGGGQAALDELYNQTQEYLYDEKLTIQAFDHQIAFNAIPHIDIFMKEKEYEGYTREEWKMIVETKKIFGDDSIEVAPTCVRVPVFRCHAESINVELKRDMTPQEARAAFVQGDGIALYDQPSEKLYPMPGLLQGTDVTYIGRVRKDPTVEHGLAFWCVADQLRKGAALNAVQILELLIENG